MVWSVLDRSIANQADPPIEIDTLPPDVEASLQ